MLTDEERKILAAIKKRYAGDFNIETVFHILDRLVSLVDKRGKDG